jgi:hypothetical protein
MFKKKTEELNIKYRKVKWLLDRTSQLSIQNKILVYNQVIKPVWTHGIQRCQNKVMREIANASWYIRNSDIHRDLGIRIVTAEKG